MLIPESRRPQAIWLILFGFVLLGAVYVWVTPVFEASDELWHYPMVQHLANGNALPVQSFDAAQAGPWKQEASQPPLYYYLGAALTFWIDTSDLDEVRWLNPHVDNGVITRDGNINLAVHDPGADPWTGSLLAVRLVRAFSVLLGAATVYLTYRITAEVLPDRPAIAAGAAAVNAFTPMFVFISGAVNNDNLVIPLASLALLVMIRLVKTAARGDPHEGRGGDLAPDIGANLGKWTLLGLVVGAGALTKISALGLLPLAALTVALASWLDTDVRQNPREVLRVVILRGLAVLLPVLLVAGWWYLRNLRLYGDWSGWNAFIAVLGQRSHPASLAQLWDERQGFMMSYWGLFGGVNVPMAQWTYRALNGILILSVPGFAYFLLREAHSLLPGQAPRWAADRSRLRQLVARYYGLAVCLLWSLAVAAGLVRWATVTWSSQGRLVFSAISSLSCLMVIGIAAWLPKRLTGLGLLAPAVLFFSLSAAAPFLWIRPAYVPPATEVSSGSKEVGVVLGNKMELVSYKMDRTEAKPGEFAEVELYWRVVDSMERDWSVFVHLNDRVLNRPVAQRDMYFGQGLRATSLLKPGEILMERYHLTLPSTALAPNELDLVVGLYDLASGERMMTADGSDAIRLDTLALRPEEGTLPNPVSVNFGNELEIIGYSLDQRLTKAGEELEFTVYWRPMKRLDNDYTFFAQVLDKDTTRWASHDLMQPTAAWREGETQAVRLQLKLDPSTPANVYPIVVGVYTRPDSRSFNRLQIVTPEGRLTDDFLELTNIRVE